jgi:NAD(P)-dependent dehydrogenase (short-subunit alcohol dehydrogenase family)
LVAGIVTFVPVRNVCKGDGEREASWVVTGANSGIGRSSAVAMAREGARVAVVSRGVAEGEDAAAEVAAVSERWGPALHCLFNNVGGVVRPSGQPTEQMQDFEATLRLSLTSAWMVTEACWSALCAARGASVVNNSSAAVAAFSARHMEMIPGVPPASYFAAKAALEGLTATTRRWVQPSASG